MNSLIQKYEIAINAVEELSSKLAATEEPPRQTHPPLARASLAQILESFAPFPKAALFLGVAEDGLPVLLNLKDPSPGPIFITGDPTSGKTALLQTIGRAIPPMHTPQEVQFGVITEKPLEWRAEQRSSHCMGVFSHRQQEAEDLILSLADWAHHNRYETRFAVLLIDHLESIEKMSEKARQNLRWLLFRGPNRRVWVFAALNAQKIAQHAAWVNAFRTRLLGAVKNIRTAQTVLPAHDAELHLLEPKREFLLNENNRWIKFRIPTQNRLSPPKETQNNEFESEPQEEAPKGFREGNSFFGEDEIYQPCDTA